MGPLSIFMKYTRIAIKYCTRENSQNTIGIHNYSSFVFCTLCEVYLRGICVMKILYYHSCNYQAKAPEFCHNLYLFFFHLPKKYGLLEARSRNLASGKPRTWTHYYSVLKTTTFNLWTWLSHDHIFAIALIQFLIFLCMCKISRKSIGFSMLTTSKIAFFVSTSTGVLNEKSIVWHKKISQNGVGCKRAMLFRNKPVCSFGYLHHAR